MRGAAAVALFIFFSLPGATLAQLSSTNFIVTGQSISGTGQSTNASSTNFQSDQESGGLYTYDVSTSSSGGGSSSSGGAPTPTSSSTPSSSSTPPTTPTTPPSSTSSPSIPPSPPTGPGGGSVDTSGGGSSGDDDTSGTSTESVSARPSTTTVELTAPTIDDGDTAVSGNEPSSRTPIIQNFGSFLADQTLSLLQPLQTYIEPIISLVDTRSTNPVALGSGAFLALFGVARVPFSFSHILRSLYHLWSNLIGLVAFQRKRRAWGTVYDSETKIPLDPAYVELFDQSGAKVAEAITDLDGRYGFLVDAGIYSMKVQKTNYNFPTHKQNLSDPDVVYSNIYYGGELVVNDSVTKDIPMDPVEFDWNQYEKIRTNQLKFIDRFDIIAVRLLDILFYAGVVLSIWQVATNPTTLNIAIVGLYAILLLSRMIFGGPILYGRVVMSGQVVPFAVVSALSDGAIVRSTVSDAEGRYSLLVQPGTYQVAVDERQPDGSYENTYMTTVKAKRGVINDVLKI